MYDSMSISLMEKANIIYEEKGKDAAERILIKYYKGEIKDKIYQIQHKSKELSIRYELIQNAFREHFEEHYYASVPLFLIIVDGAINDFTKSKGFFAEGTEVTAWDCLVGGSDSLGNLKNIFNKRRGKTNFEEIRMPYRNGIFCVVIRRWKKRIIEIMKTAISQRIITGESRPTACAMKS